MCEIVKENFVKFGRWTFPITKQGFDEAVREGCLPIAEWFNDHQSEYSRYKTMVNACKRGNIDLVKWSEKKYPAIMAFDSVDEYIEEACMNLKLDVAEWLLQGYPNADIDSTFKLCLFNQLYTGCDLIYKYRPAIELAELFIATCGVGDIAAAKYLYGIDRTLVYEQEGECFVKACMGSHVDIAMWLHLLHPERFILTVGDYEIVDWSISLPIEQVHVENIDTCPICYERKSTILTHCNHQFCDTCIRNVLNMLGTTDCPYCRQTLTPVRKINNIS